MKGNNTGHSFVFFCTSPFGSFALIGADPKVVVVTETINSKEKIKLRWSMFNLENNNYNQKHSLPMTRKLLASEVCGGLVGFSDSKNLSIIIIAWNKQTVRGGTLSCVF